MELEKCPCCPNHCPKDNLGRGKGREHFSHSNDSIEKTTSEKVIIELQRCGHLLHHNRNFNNDKLLSNFSEEELDKLYELLFKVQQ